MKNIAYRYFKRVATLSSGENTAYYYKNLTGNSYLRVADKTYPNIGLFNKTIENVQIDEVIQITEEEFEKVLSKVSNRVSSLGKVTGVFVINKHFHKYYKQVIPETYSTNHYLLFVVNDTTVTVTSTELKSTYIKKNVGSSIPSDAVKITLAEYEELLLNSVV